MTKPLDPAIKLQRAEERACTCGAAGSGESHTDWCPAEKFDRIPRHMSAADGLKFLAALTAGHAPESQTESQGQRSGGGEAGQAP